ncbi:RNA polymerase sigma factor SigJ [Rhizomonospora bruguierae]|uniref:RNA polymerase sigma factor SigJ n=1 Tax=Rhizomonospora bruguierae TaxID=1581705 RepID=UPI001BCC59F9|nr:RNA polymerase sigma factor SigJ [Micromonospora sp. NBRC 107566]
MGDEFEAERDHLMAVAYRMLGSRGEAEDAVQEAWLRYAGADRDEIRDLSGWLTTTTARICLDQLRSARVRRAAYVGPWLPEPLVTRLPGGAPDPGERAARADEVGLALLVVLERLTPEQRVAFVLHDVFAVPFEEIATALGSTPAAARQLATRARRAVAAGRARHTADLAEQRRVLRAFVAAAESGDLTGLLAVLAPDVVMVGDGGGLAPAARKILTGPDRVAALVQGLFRLAGTQLAEVHAELALVNGALGFIADARYPDGSEQRMVLAFAVADGRITAIYDQLNPGKLTRVPRPDPAAPWPPA